MTLVRAGLASVAARRTFGDLWEFIALFLAREAHVRDRLGEGGSEG